MRYNCAGFAINLSFPPIDSGGKQKQTTKKPDKKQKALEKNK